jgi:DNA-binding transcriptional MerR regulator
MLQKKSSTAFRTIAELADELGVATHVLRFWETKFDQIKPMKRSGGRRYYRPDDVELIKTIKHYLYDERYTIEGVQKLFRDKGIKTLVGDEIQKDLFEALPQEVEISGETREVLVNIRDQLNDVAAHLRQALS